MALILSAACGCTTGKIRKNNEDNFYFDGQILPADNNGSLSTLVRSTDPDRGLLLSIFDGMGGENFGEQASYAAAACMRDTVAALRTRPEDDGSFLVELCEKMNASVNKAKETYLTSHMGTTMVAFLFMQGSVYSCNLGDSKSYLLRGNVLRLLSEVHADTWSMALSGGKKAPITQFLGIDPEEFMIEPYLFKQEYRTGDRYLLCSDGISDMLEDDRIAAILREAPDAKNAVENLIAAAMSAGGKDNATAIVCFVDGSAETVMSVPESKASRNAGPAEMVIRPVPESTIGENALPGGLPVAASGSRAKKFVLIVGCVLCLFLIVAGICFILRGTKKHSASSGTETEAIAPPPDVTSDTDEDISGPSEDNTARSDNLEDGQDNALTNKADG